MDIKIQFLKSSGDLVLVIKDKGTDMELQREKQRFSIFHNYLLSFMDRSPNAIFIHVDNIIKYANTKAMEFVGAENKLSLIGTDIREELKPGTESL